MTKSNKNKDKSLKSTTIDTKNKNKNPKSKTESSSTTNTNVSFLNKTYFKDRKDRDASDVWNDILTLKLGSSTDPSQWSHLKVRRFANIMTTCRSIQMTGKGPSGNLTDLVSSFGNYARIRPEILALTDPFYVVVNWFDNPRVPIDEWLLPNALTGENSPILVDQTESVFEVSSESLAHALCGSLSSQFQNIAVITFINAIPILVYKRTVQD